MSDICSEKDCRTLFGGGWDDFGTSTDIFGEGKSREKKVKKENFLLPTPVKGGFLYASDRRGCNAIRVSNDQVPALLIGSHSHV